MVAAVTGLLANKPMDNEMNKCDSHDLFIAPPVPMSDLCSSNLFIVGIPLGFIHRCAQP
jgi:hypothetical protein